MTADSYRSTGQSRKVRVSPLHVALIMDGNGRWARARGLPRVEGHRRGADVVRELVESAPDLGVGTLSLYAFSSDNWKRPEREVAFLMALFRTFLCRERRRCVKEGVRVSVVGRRDRLSAGLVREIERTESATREGRVLSLRICVDYSARDRIVAAADLMARDGKCGRDAFARALGQSGQEKSPSPDVDLLVRTGGEQRLSDFLLWECAYAELLFVEQMWPEFGKDSLGRAIDAFGERERRFGTVPVVS
ncbi:MAG: di-trans,poly-cis-decaprenylcistransferase [Planctomycetes bacterium]|nr:di-trans,poly-cis-decaprenylcistransferase [Planctomycetota bacterium]